MQGKHAILVHMPDATAPSPAASSVTKAYKRFQVRVAKAFHAYTGTIGTIQAKTDARKAEELKGKIQGS